MSTHRSGVSETVITYPHFSSADYCKTRTFVIS